LQRVPTVSAHLSIKCHGGGKSWRESNTEFSSAVISPVDEKIVWTTGIDPYAREANPNASTQVVFDLIVGPLSGDSLKRFDVIKKQYLSSRISRLLNE
jgi:hypothetical protein